MVRIQILLNPSIQKKVMRECNNCKKEITRKSKSKLCRSCVKLRPKSKVCIKCFTKVYKGPRCSSCAQSRKNNPAWGNQYRLGIKHTEEAKKKMIETRRLNGNLGKMTEEMKMKISKNSAKIWLGKKLSKEHVEKMVATMRKNGHYKPHSLERRRKVSEKLKGSKSYLWRGGKVKKTKALRRSIEGREWRTKVFERDKFICQHRGCEFCDNQRGALLNANHIKPISKFPEFAHNLYNGITYCQDYHLSGKHGMHQFVRPLK